MGKPLEDTITRTNNLINGRDIERTLADGKVTPNITKKVVQVARGLGDIYEIPKGDPTRRTAIEVGKEAALKHILMYKTKSNYNTIKLSVFGAVGDHYAEQIRFTMDTTSTRTSDPQ